MNHVLLELVLLISIQMKFIIIYLWLVQIDTMDNVILLMIFRVEYMLRI